MSEPGTPTELPPALDLSRAVPMLPWTTYTELHQRRRHRATELAAAGTLGPAFGTWAFSDQPDLVELASDWLSACAPTPSAAAWRAAMADPEVAAAPPDTPRSARQHRQHLARVSQESPDPEGGRAWSIAELDWLGEEIEIRERATWRAVSYRSLPEADARAAEAWTGWCSGSPWLTRDAWEADCLPAARRSFRAVCAARKLPPDVTDRAVGDLQDAFFFQLLGGGEGSPGWVDLAARTLETRLPGPVIGLVDVLDEGSWARVARCAVQRGSWQRTIRELSPELPEPLARARRLYERIEGGQLEALLDLHVVSRILGAWSQDTGSPWAIVTQNRGRARGRLRAVLGAADPSSWIEALLGLDTLHARTVAATRRFAWAWAWDQLSRDFSFDFDRSLTPPCVAPDHLGDPLPSDAVRTWVLLVVLRGRLEHLERWVATGGTGDRDSTWARLLSDACPAALRDAGETGPGLYRSLRADLSTTLADHLQVLYPLLNQLAQVRGRDLAGQFRALLAPTWDESVPPVTRGFPTIQRAVDAAIDHLDLEDPCNP